jgi:hypothetical protein
MSKLKCKPVVKEVGEKVDKKEVKVSDDKSYTTPPEKFILGISIQYLLLSFIKRNAYFAYTFTIPMFFVLHFILSMETMKMLYSKMFNRFIGILFEYHFKKFAAIIRDTALLYVLIIVLQLFYPRSLTLCIMIFSVLQGMVYFYKSESVFTYLAGAAVLYGMNDNCTDIFVFPKYFYSHVCLMLVCSALSSKIEFQDATYVQTVNSKPKKDDDSEHISLFMYRIPRTHVWLKKLILTCCIIVFMLGFFAVTRIIEQGVYHTVYSSILQKGVNEPHYDMVKMDYEHYFKRSWNQTATVPVVKESSPVVKESSPVVKEASQEKKTESAVEVQKDEEEDADSLTVDEHLEELQILLEYLNRNKIPLQKVRRITLKK